MANYSIDRQRIRPFKFVAGQNPDTDIHTTRGNLTWTRDISPYTNAAISASYQRAVSLLTSEPHAVGPRVRFGHQFEELGPDSMFPIDRTGTNLRYGAALSHRLAGGRHTLTWGGDLARNRQAGIESNNSRGYLQFTSNFGRTAIENFLLGTPTIYEIALGDLDRKFSNFTLNGYFADRWQVHQRLQLYAGVRYMADSRPVESHGIDKIPYAGDYNNFSPRFSLAWQAGKGWVVRTMYTTSFMQIPPVTYQQVRNNPPRVYYIAVQNPPLTDPLKGVSTTGGRYTPTWISPDLVAPYSHQYNMTIEKRFGWGGLMRTSYIGSRTIKLLNSIIQNRAEPVPGIPLTTATVNLRRPDPRYYETYTILNGGNAYFDAGQVALDLPSKKGFTGQFSYSFSKALDEGPDFSATAANQDLVKGRSQWQYESFKDRRVIRISTRPTPSPPATPIKFQWHVTRHHGFVWFSVAGPSRVSICGRKGPRRRLTSAATGRLRQRGRRSVRPAKPIGSIDFGGHYLASDIAPEILRRDRFSFITPGENAATWAGERSAGPGSGTGTAPWSGRSACRTNWSPRSGARYTTCRTRPSSTNRRGTCQHRRSARSQTR